MQTRRANTKHSLISFSGPRKENIVDSNGFLPSAAKKAALKPETFVEPAPLQPKKGAARWEQLLDQAEFESFARFRAQRALIREVGSYEGRLMSQELFRRDECGEFQHANFDYLQDYEMTMLPLRKNFIERAGHDITPRMRYILVNWLVDVHKSYQMNAESLYLSVALMDRYLQRTSRKITKDQLQLIALTSLYVAAKFEEIFPPEIGDFVTISDNIVNKTQIKDAEKDLLKTLGFNLSYPAPIVFLRRLTSAMEADSLTHNLAKYLLELSIGEYELSHLPGNARAAMAVCVARALSQGVEELRLVWTTELQYLTGLKLEDIEDGVCTLAKAAYRQNASSRYRAIKNKYAENPALDRVSELGVLKSELMEKIGRIEFDA